MIKCHMDRDKGRVEIAAGGSLKNIGTELMAIMHECYIGIKENSPESADEFKRVIIAATIDPASPIWAEE